MNGTTYSHGGSSDSPSGCSNPDNYIPNNIWYSHVLPQMQQQSKNEAETELTLGDKYALWLAGDNDLFFSLDSETQEKLKYRLKSEVVQYEYQNGFPTLSAGFEFGLSVVAMRRVKSVGLKQHFARKEIDTSKLKRLSKSDINNLGGEAWTSQIKRQTGKSKADLYLDPKTGHVYSIPKNGGPPQWVDTILPK